MRIAAKNGLKAAVLVAVPLAVITAVTVNLPEKVGDGYTFRHRLLQDYFAELG